MCQFSSIVVIQHISLNAGKAYEVQVIVRFLLTTHGNNLHWRINACHTDVLLAAKNGCYPFATNVLDGFHRSYKHHAVTHNSTAWLNQQFRLHFFVLKVVSKHLCRSLGVGLIVRYLTAKLSLQRIRHLTKQATTDINTFRNNTQTVNQVYHSFGSCRPVGNLTFGKVALEVDELHVLGGCSKLHGIHEILPFRIKAKAGNHTVVHLVVATDTHVNQLVLMAVVNILYLFEFFFAVNIYSTPIK